MAQVARAGVNAAGGDPRSLKRLSVQFRGMGFPEQEIAVTGSVKEERDGRVVIAAEAEQGGNKVIKNAEAELAQLATIGAWQITPRQTIPAPQAGRGAPRAGPAGRLQMDRRAGRRAVGPVDGARGAGQPRGGRSARASAHLRRAACPTDRGYRVYVDELIAGGPLPVPRKPLELTTMRREVDEAMRATSEQLSQVTNLLALVTAPPIETATIRRVEVLLLQPQVAMVVIITSTGGVTKRVISYDAPVDPGLVDWASSYLNEALGGLDVGSRALQSRLAVEGAPSRRSSTRSRRPSPSSRTRPRARCSWRARRGSCPSTASRSSRRSAR